MLTTVAVAHWLLSPGNLPVTELLVSGYLHVAQGTPFLVTVAFMDPAGQWALGKTYRVDGFPNDQYDPQHDCDLTEALRDVLCR